MIPPEKWAFNADVQDKLARMLELPWADHRVAVADMLHTSLTWAHVVGLFQLIDGKTIKWGSQRWSGSSIHNRGVVLHAWLYHLLGAGADLYPPPRLKDTTSVVFSTRRPPRTVN